MKYFEESRKFLKDGSAEIFIANCKRKLKNINKSEEKKEASTIENKQEQTVDPEKDAECEEIIKKKDYYEILGVTKESTEEEVKRSYKKLALKFHPDKNQSQHASEAFKKVF